MKSGIFIFLLVTICLLSLWGQGAAQSPARSNNMREIRLSAPELEMRVVKRLLPQYPSEVIAAYLQGAMGEPIVEVRINERGKVTEAKAIAGVSLLRPYAIEAVRNWEFDTTKLGTPATIVGTIILPVPREIYGLDLNVGKNLEYYQEMANQDPTSWIAQCILAKAFSQKRRYQEAIETYKKALFLNPKASIAHYGLGRSYCPSSKQCEREKALHAYERAIELDPNFIEAWIGTAWIKSVPETRIEAIEVWKKILQMFPDLETRRIAYQNLFIQTEDKTEKVNALKELVRVKEMLMEIKPDSQARFSVGAEYIHLASRYRDVGKYEEAIECYQKAIDVAPATQAEWEASFSMVDVYKKKGNHREAMITLQEMLAKVNKRFQPNSTREDLGSIYHAQGRIYEEMGQLTDALAAYQSALKQRPNWIKPHVELYYLYRKLGNQIAAEKELAIIRKHDEEFAHSIISHDTRIEKIH